MSRKLPVADRTTTVAQVGADVSLLDGLIARRREAMSGDRLSLEIVLLDGCANGVGGLTHLGLREEA